MNPGGSVKDRAALFVVKDAEEKGLIKPGGTVVEGTAGNTGIGLAHVCRAKGYKCVIYMPNTQVPLKQNKLNWKDSLFTILSIISLKKRLICYVCLVLRSTLYPP